MWLYYTGALIEVIIIKEAQNGKLSKYVASLSRSLRLDLMRILLLADANSPHTIKWAKALSENGCNVAIFSLSNYPYKTLKDCSEVRVFSAQVSSDLFSNGVGSLSKLKYIYTLPLLWKVIQEFSPKVIHAHFASSYGLLGVLSGFRPCFISVWGSDVYEFPRKSLIHKFLLKFVLGRATKLFSTSKALELETKLYTSKAIKVIPFGIDVDRFKQGPGIKLFDDKNIVIGLVKGLEERYGIHYLIEAFSILKAKRIENLKLLIVGGGSQRDKLELLSNQFGLKDQVLFTGNVPFEDVCKYHNSIDVEVYPSIFESFGVAVLEASACERPVIASNVGGLPEVILDGVTGLIITPRSPEAICTAIEKILDQKELKISFGRKGREFVIETYNWDKSVQDMLRGYCF